MLSCRAVVPYLLLADLSNNVLSALLTFSDVVVYPYYEDVPRLGGGTALDDRAAAGVLMWVPGSVAYLVPLLGIVISLLSAEPTRPAPKPVPVGGQFALPLAGTAAPRFDLTRAWVVGPFLRWLVVFSTAHEAWSLWDWPAVMAAIVVGYFVAAFAGDSLFRSGTFCKHVCPVGQFDFVQSLATTLEVDIRDPKICTACTTKDCVRGRRGIPGCELDLAQPRKRGNMDCTFCPGPGRDLADDRPRLGVGRFSRRPDLAAFAVVVVFAVIVNAAGMTGPVFEQMRGTLAG